MIRLAKSLPKPIYKPKPKVETVEEIKIEPSTALNQEKEIELLTSINETLNKPEEKEVEEVESVKVVFPEVQKVEVMNFPKQKECEHEMPEFPSEIKVSNLNEIKGSSLPEGLATSNLQEKTVSALKKLEDLLKKLDFTEDGELKTTSKGNDGFYGVSTGANQLAEMQILNSILDQLADGIAVAPTTSIHPGTESSVAQSATSVTLLAENTSRSGGCIRNSSASRLYISRTGKASTNSPEYIDFDEIYYIPIMANGEPYRGIITGIWAAAGTGPALIVENV